MKKLIFLLLVALSLSTMAQTQPLHIYIGNKEPERLLVPILKHKYKGKERISYQVESNYYTWSNPNESCRWRVSMLHARKKIVVTSGALPDKSKWINEKHFCDENIRKNYLFIFDWKQPFHTKNIYLIADGPSGNYILYPVVGISRHSPYDTID